MNRRYSTSRRKRKLHFLERILEEPDENISADVHAIGDTIAINKCKGNEEDDNFEGGPADFEEWKAKFDKEILGEEGNEANGDRDTEENNNDIHDKDVKFYLDMFGLKHFSVDDGSAASSNNKMTSIPEDDDSVNKENKKECHMNDASLTDDWDIIEIDVFGTSDSKDSNRAAASDLDEFDLNGGEEEYMEIDTSVDYESRANSRVTKPNSINRSTASEVNGSENLFNDWNVDGISENNNDDTEGCDEDSDEKSDDEGSDDDDEDNDDDDDNSDDESHDGDSEYDEDDTYVTHQDQYIANITDKNYRETEGLDEEQNSQTDAECIKERSKRRHKDVEERIKKHIEEIERQMKVLKRKGQRKRKRCTYCKHSRDDLDFQPQLSIKPIERSKRLAEPIRHAILKRHALRSAWAGFKGSCCGKGCWSRWKWVNIKRVLSDYW